MTSPPPLAVGCTRVSTLQQDDNYGQATQAEEIRQEAARRGWTLLDTVYEVESGAKEERATVARYYALAEQHPGLHFIFPRVDRIGRRAHLILGIVSELHKRGATVHTVGIPMSLRSKEGMLMLTMLSGVAEFDYSGITERLHRGKYAKAARNLWPHGSPPYGYRIVRDERGKSLTLEPYPDTAPVVRRIFEHALAGEGSAHIAAGLVSAGIAPPRPGKSSQGLWTMRHVLYVLANEAYTGRRPFTGPDGETAVVTFEPMVTPAEFARVRALVSGRRRHRPARTRFPALWAGHIRCALCGGGLAVFCNYNDTKAGRKHYVNYRCRNTYQSGAMAIVKGTKVCTHRRIHNHLKVDEAGWALFVQAMSNPAALAQAAGGQQPSAPDHSARLGELRGQMADIVRRAVLHGLPDEVVTAALDPLRVELGALERDTVMPEPEPLPDMTDLAAQVGAHLAGLHDLEARREALDTWQARLYLGMEGIERVEMTVQRG